jgi:predicted nucleotidyltransferase
VAYTVILETVHGSQAYGLARAGSDVDRKGVYVGEPRAFLGYRPWPGQVELSPDHTLYDIRKFFTLAAVCNPTVIELLFTDPADRLQVTSEGEELLEHRRAFLSRRAGDSFGRYGLAQLRRIRTHRRWLLMPDGSPLTPRERQQYDEWVRKRNPERAELERKHGYDTKHAMHLLRLLRMAREILERGEVLVKRPDAAELLSVRDGALSFDDLLARAEEMGEALPRLAAASPLPDQPDEEHLDALCCRIVRSVHSTVSRGGEV